MTAIVKINNENKKEVASALREAMADVADQFGLDFDLTVGEQNSHSINWKVKFKTTLDEEGNVIDSDKERFERLSGRLSVPADWYHRNFWDKGTKYQIKKLIPSRPKNCVQIERVKDGKTFVCPPSYIENQL